MGDTLGGRMRRMRQQRGDAQGDTAKACGVDQGTVSRWEKDEREPSAGELRLFCAHYEVPADWLLTGHPPAGWGAGYREGIGDAIKALEALTPPASLAPDVEAAAHHLSAAQRAERERQRRAEGKRR